MAILFMATLAFADTLYLKDGSEIKDVKIVKIGVSEVEYKIGKRDVLYTAKKSDIAIIFYADGTKETFKDDGLSSEKQNIIVNTNVNQNNNQNVNVAVGGQAAPREPAPTRCGFTANERWGTWALNIIPGLGSIAVMDDWTGAVVQWGLVGGAVVSGTMFFSSVNDDEDSYGDYDVSTNTTILKYVFGGLFWGNLIWNTYRSITYCKPGSVACGSNSGFNISVMPTRHGSLLPAVTYSRGF
jgi:hypothetical protein